MPELLRQIIRRNRAGERIALPSVCSAHPDVLRAALQLANRLGQPLAIEATSNQVNQDGGYMGMRAADFASFVLGLADETGLDRAALTLGGDHLGTQAWRDLPSEAAMAKARVLVRSYAQAGFTKIHLDCSEGCRDEPALLPDEVTAQRSSLLAQTCAQQAPDLLFVIGTEVPPPGGARLSETGDIPATTPEAAKATLAAHDAHFGLLAPLIGGLVVQPGVEFGPTDVHPLPLSRDPGLIQAISHRDTICLEAHSTDYQPAQVFPRLADLGFAFQKVGPALSFAYRTALYALDRIRPEKGALQRAMEAEMLAFPNHWERHYHGDADARAHQRHFGLSDRIRYYWPAPRARAAVASLRQDCTSPLPDHRLREVFDPETLDRAETLGGPQVQRLIDAQIERALEPYFFAGQP